MPRYDYECPTCQKDIELVHLIKACEIDHFCAKCKTKLIRKISAPHIEGSYIYPFNLWNLDFHKDEKHLVKFDKKGNDYITVNNKAEHKNLMKKHKSDTPFLHVGG